MLKQNFGDRWVTREFRGQNNTAEVEEWILSEPEAVAFSSHTMMGPLPQIDGANIVSIMLLRDPIARIKSAYRFERDQQADTFGAVLAKHTDLEGYVKVRLSLPHDRQCRNFQTHRLASLVPGPEPEVERAKRAMEKLTVLGLVEDFDRALKDLGIVIRATYPAFKYTEQFLNVSSGSQAKDVASPLLEQLLNTANESDLGLVKAAKNSFAQ